MRVVKSRVHYEHVYVYSQPVKCACLYKCVHVVQVLVTILLALPIFPLPIKRSYLLHVHVHANVGALPEGGVGTASISPLHPLILPLEEARLILQLLVLSREVLDPPL